VAANLTVSGVRMETDNDATVIDYTSSLNDLAALTTAHADWGLKEISSTLAPGLYRLDIADALFASGAWTAVVYVMVTSSAAAASPMEFVIVTHDPNDLGTKQSGDSFARIGANGASLTALATQASVDDLPTNAELATALGTADDAVLTAINDLPTNAELATALGTADDAVLAQIALVKTETDKIAAVLADTNELQTDWADGGRLDLILDARSSQASVDDLPTNAELATALGTADDAVLTAINDLPTNAELATALGTADDAVLAQIALVKTETDKIAAVKTKTDSLTFTKALELDVNIQSVNGTTVNGTGASGDEWGP
jgi:hypothetical protein